MKKTRYVTLGLDVLMLALAAAGGIKQTLEGNGWHALTYAILVCWIVVARVRAVLAHMHEDSEKAARRRAARHAATLVAIRSAADKELKGEA